MSVDSPYPANYERIRKGAKFSILTKRLPLIRDGFVVFTLQRSNFREVEDIGRFTAKLGLGLIINVVRTDDSGYKHEFNKMLTDNWEELLDRLSVLHSLVPKKHLLIPDQIWGRIVPEKIATTFSCGRLSTCPNIQREVMIGYDGAVFPCNMFNPEMYGSLNSASLRKIWESERHVSFLENHKLNYYCQNCECMIPKGV